MGCASSKFEQTKTRDSLGLRVNWLTLLYLQAGRYYDEEDSDGFYRDHLKPAIAYLASRGIHPGQPVTDGLIDSADEKRCSVLEPLPIDTASFTERAKQLVTKVHVSQFWYKSHYRTAVINRVETVQMSQPDDGRDPPKHWREWITDKVVKSQGGSIDLRVLLAWFDSSLDVPWSIGLAKFKRWVTKAGLPVDDENRINGWCGNWM